MGNSTSKLLQKYLCIYISLQEKSFISMLNLNATTCAPRFLVLLYCKEKKIYKKKSTFTSNTRKTCTQIHSCRGHLLYLKPPAFFTLKKWSLLDCFNRLKYKKKATKKEITIDIFSVRVSGQKNQLKERRLTLKKTFPTRLQWHQLIEKENNIHNY